MRIRIIVAGHKAYRMPKDSVYLPLQVGAALADSLILGWERDDRGKNISEKNRTFCELTGLYWAWKNLDADILGLCHYRRYFGAPDSLLSRMGKAKENRILTGEQIEDLLEGKDVILPGKRHYWIETRESQYAHAHHAADLQVAEEVLREKFPEYIPAWKKMLASRSGHICNMFIMRRELLDEYCGWLFDILFEVEKRLDISSYSENDRRAFGFLGERLLDVWLDTRGVSCTEVPMINMESQHWLRKGSAFVKRKWKA